MRWLRHTCLAVFAALAGMAHSARAQTSGRILLQDAPLGLCLWVEVDQFGVAGADDGRTTGAPCVYGATSFIAATDAGLLSYNYYNGKTTVFRRDALGVGYASGGPTFSPIWTTLQPIGKYVFLYDGKQTGAIVSINSDLSITQTDTLTNLSPWTNVLTTDNYIVFYNATTGAWATGVVTIAGKFSQTASGYLETGYNRIVVSKDSLFFYNTATGAYRYAAVIGFESSPGSADFVLYKSSQGTIARGYTVLSALGNYLLAYTPVSGAARVVYLPNVDAGIITVQQMTLPRYFTSIVAAGANFFFYNSSAGSTAVGSLNRQGQLTLLPSPTLDTGFNYVTVTRQ